MASGYLQGGDKYQLLDSNNWAGQTFRVESPFTLKWVELNLKLTNRSCEPRVYIFAADSNHLPVEPDLSYSRYWLINHPLPPRDWLFHESWGKSLTENHPWQQNGFHYGSGSTFKNSQIAIFNDAQIGLNISYDIPGNLCPLLSPGGKHLYLHHHSPYAYGNPDESWFSYYLETVKATYEYLIEPLISRGTLWGAWGTYESASPTVYAFDHGKGPTILDVTQAWIRGRTLAGLSNNPTGWRVKIIRLANEQFSTLSPATLYNNFVGLAHQQFTPVPDNDYDTLPPIYSFPNRLYRVRFSMTDLLLSPDLYYFMRVCCFPSLLESGQYWQYDKDDSVYTPGIRLSSINAGVDWTEHPNDDFLFCAFGTPPAPVPPPDPPLPNWVILLVEQTLTLTGYRINCWTNVPVHLSLFWTDTEPEKHKRTRIVRGLTVPDTSKYCFVTWYQIEQEESGDTVYHTFILEPWEFCDTRWFTFRALVNNEWSPSASPIFKKHRKGEFKDYTFYSLPQDGYVYYNNTVYSSVRTHSTGYIGGVVTSFIAGQAREGGHQYIYRGCLFFDTSELPDYCSVVEAQLHLFGEAFSSLHDEQDLVVVPGDDILDDGLIPGDYGDLLSATIELAKFPVTAGGLEWDTGGYNILPLNPKGLKSINLLGITKLALRGSHDINNIPDVGFIERNRFSIRSHEAGGGLMPFLTVKVIF